MVMPNTTDPRVLNQQGQNYRQQQRLLEGLRQGLASTALASGQFHVQQVQATSATEAFNEKLRKQKVTFSDAIKQRKLLSAAMREQIALQNSSISQMRSGPGRGMTDLFIPRNVGPELMNLRKQAGYYNEVLKSISQQTINWGKNTQWAGRQIMVGISIPIAAAAVGAAAAAYQIDKELTRIAKVYDTNVRDYMNAAEKQMATDRELVRVREESINNSIRLAQEYGASMKDTLKLEADLAATGLKGRDLMEATSEVTRISTLGELDHQQALGVTIALQTAFGLSTEQLTDKFNFMNQVENSTVLSIQDIAEATPRAAAGLAQAGVSVEEMTVLLVAMKEAGVDAAEGANALKSATTRILNPTARAISQFEAMGIDVQQIVQSTGGNLFQTLQQLGSQMEDAGVTNLQRLQAIASLFGTYQFNRLNAALLGVADATAGVGEGTSQAARAMDVANSSTKEWASTAETEITRYQNSISGSFSIATASFMAQFWKLGDTVLPILTDVINLATQFVKAFNELPAGTRTVILLSAAIAAVGAVGIMLMGVFANMAGQVMRLGTVVAGLGLRFKMVNSEERVAALVAQQANSAFNTQSASAARLTLTLKALEAQVAALARTQAAANGMSMAAATGTPAYSLIHPGRAAAQAARGTTAVGGIRQTATGSIRTSGGQFASQTQIYNARQVAHSQALQENARRTAAAQLQTQRAAAATSTSMAASARSGGVMAGFMVAGAASGAAVAKASGESATNYAMIGASVGMMATMLPWGRMARGARTVFGGGRGMGGMLTSITSKASILGKVFLRFLGPIGIIAGGLLYFKSLEDSMDAIQRKQEKINASAETWGEILGYAYEQGTTAQTEEDELTSGRRQSAVEALKEENRELYDQLKNVTNEQGAYNLALREGLKIANSGGGSQDVARGVEVALDVSGMTRAMDMEDLVAEITLRVTDPESNAQAIADDMSRAFNTIEVNMDNRGWYEDLMSGPTDLSDASKAQIVEAVGTYHSAWTTALESDRPRLAQDLADAFTEGMSFSFNDLQDQYSEEFETLGINSMEDLQAVMKRYRDNNSMLDGLFSDQAEEDAFVAMMYDGADATELYADGLDTLKNSLVESGVLTREQARDVSNLGDLTSALSGDYMTVADAQEEYNRRINSAIGMGREMSDRQKLNILNNLRLAAGLEETTRLEDGFGDAVTSTSDIIAENTDVLIENEKTLAQWAQQAFDSRKSIMSGVQDDVMTEMSSQLDDQIDAAKDAVKAQAEAEKAALDAAKDALDDAQDDEKKRFDDGWDDAMDLHDDRFDDMRDAEEAAYDARIAAIQAVIDAEEDANERREALFEAEIRRIERLAAMENASIDFNAALNSGDLDEAARISVGARSQEQQWGIDDQREANDKASQDRIDALNLQIELIEAEKDARLAALDDIQEAEKQALEDQKEREAELLEIRQKAAQDSLDAEMDRLDASSAAQERAADREMETRRRALEGELTAIRAYIPRNQSELDRQIQLIEAAYSRHGFTLQTQGDRWGQIVGQSLENHVLEASNAVRDEIAWDQIAMSITSEMASIFSLNGPQMIEWLRTGTFPGTVAPKSLPWQYGGVASHIGGLQSFHGGGGPGFSQKDRTGVRRGASLYPSEVPAVLKRGEFVVNQKDTRKNLPILQAINSGGNVAQHLGGMQSFHSGGVAVGGPAAGGMIGAAIGATIARSIATAITTSISSLGGNYGVGQAGVYGGVKLTAEQLANASTIMNVGRSMGATQRDLLVALMTAMQESNLKNLNYGDRDSIGLFQQRPSQGWGTVAQIMDPAYSATKFFEALFKVAGRDSLAPTVAAQRVQRSAFPNAYAKWEQMASAILSGTPMMFGGAQEMGGSFAAGGQWPAARPGIISPNTAAARAGILAAFPSTRNGGDPSLNRADPSSDHGKGKALDIFPGTQLGVNASGAGLSQGWAITRWLEENAERFGFKYWIWQKLINQGKGAVPYTRYGANPGPTLGHYDHVHASFKHIGGLMDGEGLPLRGMSIPSLRVGGNIKYDDTFANLHKGETVLTAPLSRDLKEGIQNNNKNNSYHLDFSGSVFHNEIDVKKAVYAAIEEKENKKGRSRRIS